MEDNISIASLNVVEVGVGGWGGPVMLLQLSQQPLQLLVSECKQQVSTELDAFYFWFSPLLLHLSYAGSPAPGIDLETSIFAVQTILLYAICVG